MPTPTGMLKGGDIVEFVATGQRFKVLQRERRGTNYSVMLTTIDGGPLPPGILPAFGYTKAFRLLKPADYLDKGICRVVK